MGERTFRNVVGRVSGVSSGRAEGVSIIVGEEWKRCKRMEGSLIEDYVMMNIGESKYVIVGPYGPGV